MLANPKKGQLVRIRYNQRIAPAMPLHNKVGTVHIVSRGKSGASQCNNEKPYSAACTPMEYSTWMNWQS